MGDTAPMDAVGERNAQQGGPREQSEYAGTEYALRAALDEQRMVAEFGQEALRGQPLAELLERSVDLVQEALSVEFTGVLEHLPDERVLVMRAGRGWPESTEAIRFTDSPTTQVGAVLA